MNYDDDDDANVVTMTVGPGYNVSAWITHENTGPQCSQNREFCYGCAFRGYDDDQKCYNDNGEPVQDYYTSLMEVIKTLASEDRELPDIVNTAHNIYNKDIRKHIRWEHPVTHAVIDKPEWTKESIQRHILYSRLVPDVHDSLVDHIFTGIIHAQNSRLINMDTRTVIEENRVAFMDTIKHYTAWRKHRTACKNSAARSRTKAPL